MISAKDLFFEMREQDEWCSCIMTIDTYKDIPQNIKDRLVMGDVRRKNTSFEKDKTHQGLVKSLYKAKKDLRDYEFDKNFNQ